MMQLDSMTNSGLNFTYGFTCASCGAWVPTGTSHVCNLPFITTTSDHCRHGWNEPEQIKVSGIKLIVQRCKHCNKVRELQRLRS